MYYQNSNERIPDLFRQKINYSKHMNKLGELKRRHSYHGPGHREEIIDQYRVRKQQSFYRRTWNNEEKILKENQYILGKLAKGTRSSIAPLSNSVEGRSTHESLRKKMQQKTDRDNLQIYFKLNKQTSSINNKKLESDYEKSVKIRNRISRFQKNQSQNVSILKLNKYFPLSSRSTPSSRQEAHSFNFPNDSRNPSTQKHLHTPSNKLSVFQSKLNLEYKRQDIAKNKIIDKWDMLKKRKYPLMMKQPMSQQAKKHELSQQMMKQRLSNQNMRNKRVINKDQVFPTES